MKPTAAEYAELKKRVVLISSAVPQPITVSIKQQNHSQETPTISWHVLSVQQLPSKWRHNIFGVLYGFLFFFSFFKDMS